MIIILVLLSFLFSGLIAASIHLFLGEGLEDLMWFWGLGFIGFLAGHWLGVTYDVLLPKLGAVHIIPACLGCLSGLLVANLVKV